MIIVIDVNVLFSAIIKDSTTRELLLKSEHEFYFPKPSKNKIEKYFDLILEKTKTTESELNQLLANIFCNVHTISEKELLTHWEEAKQIMHDIDPEDVTFIAAALAKDNAAIWSDDKHFEQQKAIQIFKTKDLIDLYKDQ